MSDKYESVSREALLIMIRGSDTRIAELEAENERLNIALTDSVVRDVELMQDETHWADKPGRHWSEVLE